MVPVVMARRSRTERIQDISIGALIMAILISIGFIGILQFPIPLRDTPVIFHDISLPERTVYCPGDLYSYEVDVEVTNPGVLSLHVGIKGADDDQFIASTLARLESIPRSAPARILKDAGFKIPGIPPGDYIRIVAIDADHVDSVPIFVEIPFTIGEKCEKPD